MKRLSLAFASGVLIHEQVRSSGLAVPDLEVTFYGMTEFRIEDPDGNRRRSGERLHHEAEVRFAT